MTTGQPENPPRNGKASRTEEKSNPPTDRKDKDSGTEEES